MQRSSLPVALSILFLGCTFSEFEIDEEPYFVIRNVAVADQTGVVALGVDVDQYNRRDALASGSTHERKIVVLRLGDEGLRVDAFFLPEFAFTKHACEVFCDEDQVCFLDAVKNIYVLSKGEQSPQLIDGRAAPSAMEKLEFLKRVSGEWRIALGSETGVFEVREDWLCFEEQRLLDLSQWKAEFARSK
ncbi:MAG: hypothetical protein AAF664_03520 [Planctomycetota bacterium]